MTSSDHVLLLMLYCHLCHDKVRCLHERFINMESEVNATMPRTSFNFILFTLKTSTSPLEAFFNIKLIYQRRITTIIATVELFDNGLFSLL